MNDEIIVFKNNNIQLDVEVKDETVWLSLDQMARLYGRDKSVISRHIKNAFAEELEENSTVAKFATVHREGSRVIKRQINQ